VFVIRREGDFCKIDVGKTERFIKLLRDTPQTSTQRNLSIKANDRSVHLHTRLLALMQTKMNHEIRASEIIAKLIHKNANIWVPSEALMLRTSKLAMLIASRSALYKT